MIAISLQSGSNGNCIYVEAEGVRLLFDAGISGIQAEQRLAALGKDIRKVDALIISHDHADHLRCAGIYQRKYGIPLHITPRTLAAGKTLQLGRLSEVRPFQAGEGISFGSVSVQTIPTPHDGADGVAFVVETRQRRLGILTDLGHLFQGLETVIASLDAIILESNFDPEMLEQGAVSGISKTTDSRTGRASFQPRGGPAPSQGGGERPRPGTRGRGASGGPSPASALRAPETLQMANPAASASASRVRRRNARPISIA